MKKEEIVGVQVEVEIKKDNSQPCNFEIRRMKKADGQRACDGGCYKLATWYIEGQYYCSKCSKKLRDILK